MRKTLALTAFAALALAVAAPPAIVHAQVSGSTTTQSDSSKTWEKIKGNWSQAKGKVKEQWGKLTDDDLTVIEGRRDQLVGRIQARYGVTREQAEAQVSDWEVRYGG
jgi:uncharacterized protein YjbJ (UPF0337 family)